MSKTLSVFVCSLTASSLTASKPPLTLRNHHIDLAHNAYLHTNTAPTKHSRSGGQPGSRNKNAFPSSACGKPFAPDKRPMCRTGMHKQSRWSLALMVKASFSAPGLFSVKKRQNTRRNRRTAPANFEPPKGFGSGIGSGLRSGVGLV